MPHTYIHEIPGLTSHPDVPYGSLEEKAVVLGIDEARIGKSLYLSADGMLYCAVLPASHRLEMRAFMETLGLRARPRFADRYPLGQEPGRLGPFIAEPDLALVSAIVFSDAFPDGRIDFCHPTTPGIRFSTEIAAVRETLDDRFGYAVRIVTASISSQSFKEAPSRRAL